MTTFSEMERPRSPGNLREFVVRVIEDVRADQVERRCGLLKKGPYKKFLEELVPLSHFGVWAYPDDHKIRWIYGNQGYDALVYNKTGDEVDRIEITSPHDGAKRAADSKQIVEKGRTRTQIGYPGDAFYDLAPRVLAGSRKKAEKDYSDCTLVVAIVTDPPFQTPENVAHHEEQTKILIRKMEQIWFKAKRGFLLSHPGIGDDYGLPPQISPLFNAAHE